MTFINRGKVYETRMIKQNTSFVNNHASLPETIIEVSLMTKAFEKLLSYFFRIVKK